MKTITIDDEIYRKLAEAKATLGVRSFSEALKKILSEDRVKWVYRLGGKVEIDEARVKRLQGGWKAWHIR
ncbi:MAG: antitoxin VapB family protein [Candidatus Micrarchaeota archaeon]